MALQSEARAGGGGEETALHWSRFRGTIYTSQSTRAGAGWADPALQLSPPHTPLKGRALDCPPVHLEEARAVPLAVGAPHSLAPGS